MSRPLPILETALRYKMDLEIGHASCCAIWYDEDLSETYEHREYFNLASERKEALRAAVKRAAATADRVRKQRS